MGSFAGEPAIDPPKAWPFVALGDVKPPEVQHADRVSNGIDKFILARLEDKGLSLAPQASPRTLVRRVYFDLIGLPPTPAEVESFVSDADPRAYEKLVDKLLADTRYGERWARFWLDLARYADTAGYEGDPDLPNAWRYRDYVIDSFNQDKPYDEFIIDQIAGDETEDVMGAGDLPKPKPEPTVALTFLRLAPFTEPRGDASRHELLSEMTSTVSSVFLGLTIGCAQCHDHKYDRIPTKDFYRMKAFFSTVAIPRPAEGDAFQLGGPIPAEFYRHGEKEWAAKLTAQRHDELKKQRTVIEEIEKIEEAGKRADPRVDLTEEQGQRLKEAKGRFRFLEQDILRLQPYAMSLRHSYGPPYEPGVPESRVMIRGEWNHPGEVVEAGFPSVIAGHQDPATIRLDPFKRWPTRSRRLALAEWIVSSDNPMTARVMVNRLWGWHFGRGIVATPSDFGKLGGGASHPELLDWMARQFTASKWSVKAMHRLILNSQTYRQSSKHTDPQAEEADPENLLFWHFRSRRLEAEAVRDAVLAVSGRLNPEQFGLPIFPPLPEGVAEAVSWDEGKWNTQDGPEGRKRSIYIYQQRSMTMPLMQTFDSVVCDGTRDRRQNSTTPFQALTMYNGRFANEEARHFAVRIRQEGGDSLAAQIPLAFKIALGREPAPEESERMRALAVSTTAGDGLAAICRVLLNTNEFVYVH
ncbi:hypothetical protein I41_27410 [Lacipirellula limnantheis]|uniref:Planctomycete cytochrome C n=2 Tax=Lacipirellula limnantheis TaxID=2528024 RepID=A0A517TYW1_9BACT|nr:hypothetical protein I41_27410 [Lacipirellula limnantheis]